VERKSDASPSRHGPLRKDNLVGVATVTAADRQKGGLAACAISSMSTYSTTARRATGGAV